MMLSQVIFVMVLLVTALFDASSAQPGTIPPPTTTLQVFALPVGQGDCTIMQCPNGNIIVFDCGSSGGNRMTANEIESWLGTRINNVVALLITHAHRDHYNYLYEISWNTANVRAVIIGGTLGSYRENIRNWLYQWANANKLYTIGNGTSPPPSGCIGNCAVGSGTNFCNNRNINFNILSANAGNSANQQSIVMRVVVNQWSMLLSGDMEGLASLDIANRLGAGLQSLVYKISHHGASSQANLGNWLASIRPTYAFASSGFDFGRCKHPRCETINRIRSLNTVTMTTPHTFQCGNSGMAATVDTNFQYNMLETSPDATHICLLTYIASINIQPDQNCFQPTVRSFSFKIIEAFKMLINIVGDMDVEEDC